MLWSDHGGDWYSASQCVGGELLDFSANLNPLGMPPSVVRAGQEGVAQGGRYPDPHCRALKEGLAEAEGVATQHIICGNGAADLIFRLVLALAPKRALVTAPTFSEYQQALGVVGCHVTCHALDPCHQFDVTCRLLDDLEEGIDLLFLCTPNNPTGRLIEGGLLTEILAQCLQKNITVVVDECFLSLSTGGAGLVPQLEKYPNLLLLRAFTKSYALAGLRLGYGLSCNRGLLEKMEGVGQPWSVSTPAQFAGLACLKEPNWTADARALVAEERPKLLTALRALGCNPIEGEANYLLFRKVGDSTLHRRLLTQGILVRHCENYLGLGEDYYRICIKNAAENRRLLTGLSAVIAGERRVPHGKGDYGAGHRL